MKLTLRDEDRADMVEAVQRYFREELDDDVGDLKAGLFVDFVCEELAPPIYAQAIRDAQSHLQDRLLDMEGVLTLDIPGRRR